MSIYNRNTPPSGGSTGAWVAGIIIAILIIIGAIAWSGGWNGSDKTVTTTTPSPATSGSGSGMKPPPPSTSAPGNQTAPSTQPAPSTPPAPPAQTR